MIVLLSIEYEGSPVTDSISPMSPQDALIAVTLVTAIADDRMSEKEYREIMATVNLLPVFNEYDTDRIAGIIDTVQAFLDEEDGLDDLIGLVKSAMPDKLYETAYALACDVAAADGSVALGEMRMLEELRQGLELDRLNAAAIERGARARHMLV
jgi:tellurite resistance protein